MLFKHWREYIKTFCMSVAPTTPEKNHLPEWKDSFVEEYTMLLGEDGFESYKDVASRYAPKAIRVNTYKADVSDVKERLEDDWELTSVPWCDAGYWIEHCEEDRHDIGNLLEHILGYVYVQSAASMIPPVVLDVEPGMRVVDMCAAPGSKATQLGELVGGDGVVVANDSNGHRLTALGINAQRLGLDNIIVSNMQGEDLPGTGYDRVLVDAPCSGTGTIMKSHKSVEMWGDSLVGRMEGIQRLLIRRGFDLLRPGGVMVYSTCTLQPEENEGVVSEFIEDRDDAAVEPVDLPLASSDPVTSWKGTSYDGVDDVLRIHPSDNGTEGFFVAKIRKEE
jgi:NOL1/NOP2/sun family putative RNA methylase